VILQRWRTRRSNLRKEPEQFRPEMLRPNTAAKGLCCETKRSAIGQKNALRFASRPAARQPPQVVARESFTANLPRALTILGFGALGAKRMKHARSTRPLAHAAGSKCCGVHPFGWPVGSVTTIASVVDLPLATPAAQNVFGASQTPVFISWQAISYSWRASAPRNAPGRDTPWV
jgi:hypothetical protein